MTGQHPLYNGCFSNDIQLLTNTGKSFAEALKDKGYATGLFGKWHLFGGDRDRPVPARKHRHGFDVFMSENCAHHSYSPGENFYWNEKGKKVYSDLWEPDAQAARACDFMTANADKPFAAFVSWNPPHDIGHNFGERRYEYDTEPELML